MNPAFALAVVLLLGSPLPASPVHASDAPSADALFARGASLHQAGDILGAIEAYLAALEKDASRVDARSNLGAAFAGLGRYDEAIREYRAVLEGRSEQTAVRFNLALAFYKAARVVEAAEELERVIREDAGNRRAALLLADCRLQMGNHAGVIALLKPREAEFADDRLYAYLLGNALVQANDLRRGQAYIDRVFQGGEPGQGPLLMGVVHVRRGDFRSALTELQAAVEINPDLPGVHSLLGRAYMGSGRRDEALQAFRRELQKNPNDFDANLYVGFFLKDENKLDEAEEHLKRARRLRSQDPAVLYALGALHLAAGRPEDAKKELEQVVARVPEYEQAHVLLATTYYRMKDKDRGDEHRLAAEKLRASRQSKEPGPIDELAPGHAEPGAPSPAPRDPKGGAR